AAGLKPITALAFVVGVAVLREGVEVVLLLYGIIAAGNGPVEMLSGGAIGLIIGAVLSVLMYLGLTALPVRKLFAVTIALITLLAAGMASQAVALLQQAGNLTNYASALWNTSHIVPEEGVLGQLLANLIGYSESPTVAQGAAYALVILLNIVLIAAIRRLKP